MSFVLLISELIVLAIIYQITVFWVNYLSISLNNNQLIFMKKEEKS